MADWMAAAACLDLDPDVFFPASDTSMTRTARAACNRCPVADDCLEHALDHGITHGIWGGLTPRQRRAHAAATGRTRHGTTTGYTVDRCRCQPCRDAIAENKRASVARQREASRG